MGGQGLSQARLVAWAHCNQYTGQDGNIAYYQPSEGCNQHWLVAWAQHAKLPTTR